MDVEVTGLPLAMMASRSSFAKLVRPGGVLAENTPPGPGCGPDTRTMSLASSGKAAAAPSRLSMPVMHIPQSTPLPALLGGIVASASFDGNHTSPGPEPSPATRTMFLALSCKAAAAAALTAPMPGLLHIPHSAHLMAGLPSVAGLNSTDSLLLTASGRRELDSFLLTASGRQREVDSSDMSLSHINSL